MKELQGKHVTELWTCESYESYVLKLKSTGLFCCPKGQSWSQDAHGADIADMREQADGEGDTVTCLASRFTP